MKRKMKQATAVLLSVLLVLAVLPLSAMAAKVDSAAAGDGAVTVTATSNFFPTATGSFSQEQLSANEDYITVTYFMQSTERLLNAEWLLSYDGAVLQYDASVNPHVMPNATDAVINTNPKSVTNGIAGNCASLSTYFLDDEEGDRTAFVSVTFKVIGSGETTVDLHVTNMKLTHLTDGASLSYKENETPLVVNSVVQEIEISYVPTTAVYAGAYDDDYTEPVSNVDPGITVQVMRLTFLEGLKTSFAVPTTALAGYTNVYAIVKNPAVPNGQKITDFYTEGDYTILDFYKIYPQLVVDDFEVVIYGTKNGVEYHSEPYVRSVRDYSLDLLGKIADSTTPRNIAQKACLVEMLNYAATVQLYVNYKTDDLANALLTPEQQAYSSYDSTCTNWRDYNYIDTPNACAEWFAQRLTYDSNIKLDVSFHTTVKPAEGWYAVARVNNVDHICNTINSNGSETGEIKDFYWVTIDDLWISQMDEQILLTLYDADGNAISDTMSTSLNSYYANYNGTNQKTIAIVEQMVQYGKAAKALSIYS